MTDEQRERDERRRAVLEERARKLATITEHPAWAELRGEYQRQMLKALRRLTRAEAIDLREFDYERGKLAGIAAFLDTPEKAEEILERSFRRAEAMKALTNEED